MTQAHTVPGPDLPGPDLPGPDLRAPGREALGDRPGQERLDQERLGHKDILRLLDTQTHVLELITGGSPLPDALCAVLEALEGLLGGGARCSVLLLDPATGTLNHGAAPSLPQEYVTAIDGLVVGRDAGSCGTAAYLGVPVVAEDVLVDPRWDRFRDAAAPHGLRSCWSTPIRGRSGIVGTFAVYTDAPHRPGRREQLLVERLTHLASVAIDHAGLFGALAESEERFRRAFEDNAVGMALTDLDGGFVKVNGALAHMVRRTEAELLSMGVRDVVEPESEDDVRALASVGRGGRGSAHFEAPARRPDGTVLRLSLTASVVRGADGEARHVSLALVDLTEREIAEAERRARRDAELARAAAEEASRAKTDFISVLSHELRTPLQAIRGFIELLRTIELPPERRTAALDHVDGASAHVAALVDDLLDIARIEAGVLAVEPAVVDVPRLFHAVQELLEPLADEARVTIRIDHRGAEGGTEDGPEDGTDGGALAVVADERRLRQVLINVVTNAVRYNRAEGTVTLSAAAGDEPGTVALRITDTGRGIPDELRERLFVPYDRLGSHVGADGGMGLGLSLARGLTEAMRGRLEVASTVGVGTSVTVTLPVPDLGAA